MLKVKDTVNCVGDLEFGKMGDIFIVVSIQGNKIRHKRNRFIENLEEDDFDYYDRPQFHKMYVVQKLIGDVYRDINFFDNIPAAIRHINISKAIINSQKK